MRLKMVGGNTCIRLLVAVLLGLCVGQGRCQDNVQLVDGNVMLGAVFEVNSLVNGGCENVDFNSLQEVVAVTWLIDRLNANNFVPGIRIGLDAFRTCSMPDRAVKGAMDLLTKYSNSTTQPLFGMLGPQRTAEAIVVSRFLGSLPVEQRLLQISGSATGKELSDRTLYTNFFRVIPPDTIQVQVMAELLEALDWNYVAIVHDDDDYGLSAATELRRLAQDRQICVPVFESLPVDTGSAIFNTRIEAISTQMKSNGLIRGLVIIGGHQTSNRLIRQLSSEAKFVHVILSEAIGLQSSALTTSSGEVMVVARGALLTSPQYVDVPEFRTFWNSLWTDKQTFTDLASHNPWLATYFQSLAGCDVTAQGCWEGVANKRASVMIPDGSSPEGLSLYIWYNLKATAVMAALLRQLQSRLCGSTYNGLCDDFSEAIKGRATLQSTLENSQISLGDMSSTLSTFGTFASVNFGDSADERRQPGEREYTVYNFQQNSSGTFFFKQVGALVDNSLSLEESQVRLYNESGNPLTLSQVTPAQCDVNRDCLQCENDISDDVLFVEGDFYVVGLVPIHAKHTTNLLKCGEIQSQAGADLAEAVLFAVEDVNKKTGDFRNVLPNRKVGLVVINTCSSPLLVRQRLLDLHSGRLTLPDGRNTSFLIPKIMGYVGAYTSSNSIAAASTLTDIDHTFVQVSGVSTSPELKDRTKYPYFMRIVPADDTQAVVLLRLLEKVGASYIQVVYDGSTTYATGLYHAIENEISTGKYNVCIAQAIKTTPRTDSSEYISILDRLRTAPSARAVIILLHISEIPKAMDAILPRMSTADNFVFFCTDSWGRRQFLIDDRRDLNGANVRLEGTLILSQEVAVDKPFLNYFRTVNIATSENPWLKYFWQERLNCYFDKSFLRAGKTGPCPPDYAQDYVQDVRAPFYIDCVYALVLGFDSALSKVCNQHTTSKCQALTSEGLVAAMKQVKLDLYSTSRKNDVFDSNGDGLVGYKVLQVTRDLESPGDNMIYTDVGSWGQDGLTLNKEKLFVHQSFASTCPNPVECEKCRRPTTPSPQASESQGVHVGVPIGLSVFFIVVIVALVVVIVLSYHRLRSTRDLLSFYKRHHAESVSPSGDRPLPDPVNPRPPMIIPDHIMVENPSAEDPYDQAELPTLYRRSAAKESPYLHPIEDTSGKGDGVFK